jgi:bifunctional DNase/RNase
MVYNSNPAEVKIIEDLSVEFDGNDEDFQTEDTITLLENYIDNFEYSVDRDLVKSTIKSLYTEALEV